MFTKLFMISFSQVKLQHLSLTSAHNTNESSPLLLPSALPGHPLYPFPRLSMLDSFIL